MIKVCSVEKNNNIIELWKGNNAHIVRYGPIYALFSVTFMEYNEASAFFSLTVDAESVMEYPDERKQC